MRELRWVTHVLVPAAILACAPGKGDGDDDGSGGGTDGGEDPGVFADPRVCEEAQAAPPFEEPGPLGFPSPCNPRLQNGSGEHVCCSDDPAAVSGGLPQYLGRIEDGATPIFSATNNWLGTSGICVRTSDIPPEDALQEPGVVGCPVPCNPLWDASAVEAICGEGRACCQTVELEPKDCIYVGTSWRPARGTDIGEGTFWTPDEHETHQDAGLAGCTQFALGDQSVYEDCLAQLGVAAQRGFCTSLEPGEVCPAREPDYINACECINHGFCPPPG
jgi:hypothetical protein